MALTHHFIVNELAGVPEESYSLVGDDLLIKDHLPAYAKYLSIMADIGVTVNLNKTIVSAQAPFTIEFARNYIIKGHKIKPLPTGVVFAYYDKKVSSTAVLWAFRETLGFISIRKLLEHLGLTQKDELLEVAYFLWSNEILPFHRAALLLEQMGADIILRESEFEDIKKICYSEKGSPSIRLRFQFLETLLSQCSIRKESDLLQTTELQQSFMALRFADEGVEDYADVMRERMSEAIPIIYSCPFGNPTLSKREKRLIHDYLEYLANN